MKFISPLGAHHFSPIFRCTHEELNYVHQATYTVRDPTGSTAQETWLTVLCASYHMTIISDKYKFT